jgi:mitogen-activated protein kinase 1/3
MLDKYTTAIDIWSVGCIFAELLAMMRENYATVFERVPLFPGDTCYPLSPNSSIVFNKKKTVEGGEKDGNENDEI